jgi:tetratricopeptide (TPR) repeat protein
MKRTGSTQKRVVEKIQTGLRRCMGLSVALLVLSACSTPETKSTAEETVPAQKKVIDCDSIKRLALQSDSILLSQMEINEASARTAIKAFADFANFCPTDSLSPIYLIKCAQVARAIKQVPQAKVVLEKCINDYPQFKDRAAAMFLLAQLYDEVTYLNNEQEAKRLYEQILSEYPKSDWAQSAQGALLFLGKSDAEILKELKKKAGK